MIYIQLYLISVYLGFNQAEESNLKLINQLTEYIPDKSLAIFCEPRYKIVSKIFRTKHQIPRTYQINKRSKSTVNELIIVCENQLGGYMKDYRSETQTGTSTYLLVQEDITKSLNSIRSLKPRLDEQFFVINQGKRSNKKRDFHNLKHVK